MPRRLQKSRSPRPGALTGCGWPELPEGAAGGHRAAEPKGRSPLGRGRSRRTLRRSAGCFPGQIKYQVPSLAPLLLAVKAPTQESQIVTSHLARSCPAPSGQETYLLCRATPLKAAPRPVPSASRMARIPRAASAARQAAQDRRRLAQTAGPRAKPGPDVLVVFSRGRHRSDPLSPAPLQENGTAPCPDPSNAPTRLTAPRRKVGGLVRP